LEKWGDLPRIRIAYQFVMIRYESQGQVAA